MSVRFPSFFCCDIAFLTLWKLYQVAKALHLSTHNLRCDKNDLHACVEFHFSLPNYYSLTTLILQDGINFAAFSLQNRSKFLHTDSSWHVTRALPNFKCSFMAENSQDNSLLDKVKVDLELNKSGNKYIVIVHLVSP